jgi:hypothetical protein
LAARSPKHWFPAKRYGWGWGPPIVWQGWAVLAVFVVLVVAGIFVFSPETHPGRFLTYVVVLCALLGLVCWLKGERPRWRWG